MTIPADSTKLRIRVAELMGIAGKFVLVKRGLYWRPNGHGYTSDISEAWILTEEEADKHGYPHDEPVTKERAPLPAFDSDLNACHEFEEIVAKRRLIVPYLCNLDSVCGCQRDETRGDQWLIAHATAEQRCRAFIAVMEKQDSGEKGAAQ